MKNTCSFFGHRDVSDSICPLLQSKIEDMVTKYNVTRFFVGGYGNFDDYATEIIRQLKQKNQQIEIVLIVAYKDSIDRFEEYNKRKYDTVIYPEKLNSVAPRSAIIHRNRWIIENSQYMIAYVKHKSGGAWTALKYANKLERTVINLADLK